MPHQVCMGAQLKCMFGAAPSKLIVNPVAPPKMVMTDNKPAANIMDHMPYVNVPPFGMCNSPSSPVFIAATAAKLGVATPVPCTPMTFAPWSTGSPTVKLGNMPALNKSSMLTCAFGGTITIVDEGQTSHDIP